ncbi:N-6 DNA methylase [Nonomuraea sp. NPDC050556]|uniref:N-6 DNA methylase n=1 Tax=Nonomuraea sp. NPDC050556 TaxID=3364369 RepID=UPI0037BBE1B4
MSHDPTVTAGDIARLAGVGRAAVSNWRRRHDDFPVPIDGTANQPQFSLRQVEAWLRRYGKSYQVSLADRVWQRLKAAGDLRLGELVADAGALLTGGESALEPELAVLVEELAEQLGPLAAYEFLVERYLEAHSRQLSVTRDEVAELMVRLAGAAGQTVFDPACGVGTLLLAPKAGRVFGQDLSTTSACIAAARLRLRGVEAEIAAGDSMRHDGFADERADAVVCDPPFNERAWGFEELTGDPRWEYGLPPRGEPELAWVQHCLTHVKPGGLVAILMPAAAASRRSGRRIRANLLRNGALRAVITLQGSDLWLLRRPRTGDRHPSEVLIMEADVKDVEPAWEAYLANRSDNGVRIIDLLVEDVDVSPARHRRPDGDNLGRAFVETRERFLAAVAVPPDLKVLDQPLDQPMTTVGDLVKAGLVTILQAPAKMRVSGGDLPVLTADDLASGTGATGSTEAESGLVLLEAGDVVASFSSVRVMAESGAVLGPYLTAYRVDRSSLDPDFLAGYLRAAGGRATSGSSRFDARRTRLPRLPLPAQRAYGEAFRRLVALEDALRETNALGQQLIRLGLDGLIGGRLHPPA